MKAEELLGLEDVKQALVRAKARVASAPMSDLRDEAGHQYVDLVMEGGGVLGIALVGYTYILEQAGLRFLSIAGTSAGAINATLLAGLGAPHTSKSERLVELLANIPLETFIDGDHDAKQFSHALVQNRGPLSLLWHGLQIRDNLQRDLGLHPGNAFRKWMEERLAEVEIRTVAELRERMKLPAEGKFKLCTTRQDHTDTSAISSKLAIVTADVSTRTKVVLPAMSELYWPDPDSLNPAELVRASMSVPYFFWPVHSGQCPTGDEAEERWRRLAGYSGPIPSEVLFIDGGIIYNFPIGIFHQHDRVPLAPTFGVKLQLDDREPVTSPIQLGSAIFDTAREGLQQDFLVDNPDYRHLVANIDTGAHHWLDFRLSDTAKRELFAAGALRAALFLESFNWQDYKQLRQKKAEVRQTSGAPNAAIHTTR